MILKGISTVEADTVLFGREFQASFDCAGKKKKSFDIERFLVEVPGVRDYSARPWTDLLEYTGSESLD